MDKGIDPAVQERVRKLCGQITVAHALDAEIQEELYGHMEDKLLAYLAGEEKLSEEDAFILMSKHFGEASTLKVLLQDVHAHSVRASLARRLAAALVASVSIGILTGLVLKASLVALALWTVQRGMPDAFDRASTYLNFAGSIASLGLLWYLLIRWQRQLAQGQQPWFVRWPAHRMWAATGAALIAPQFIPGLVPALSEGTPSAPSGVFYITLLVALGMAPQAIEACAWLWWSDRPPRRAFALLATVITWVSLQAYDSLRLKLVPLVMIGMQPLSYLGKPVESLAHGSFFGTPLQWSLVWRGSLLATLHSPSGIAFDAMLATVIGFLIAALLGWGGYETVRFVSARIAKRNVQRQALV